MDFLFLLGDLYSNCYVDFFGSKCYFDFFVNIAIYEFS